MSKIKTTLAYLAFIVLYIALLSLLGFVIYLGIKSAGIVATLIAVLICFCLFAFPFWLSWASDYLKERKYNR